MSYQSLNDIPRYLRRRKRTPQVVIDYSDARRSAIVWLFVLLIVLAGATVVWAYRQAPFLAPQPKPDVRVGHITMSASDFCAWQYSRPENVGAAVSDFCK